MRARLTLIGAVLALVAAPAVALAADPPEPAFGGPLDGAQEVPAVITAATGEGSVVISPDGSTITYVVTFSGLSGAVAAAHIHTGAVGVAGGVILPLTASASPMTGTLTAANFSASGAVTTFAEAVAAIQAGNTYFNLHTAANPGGEIRGQIVAKGEASFASLAGFQEVPAVDTSASGEGWVLVSTDGSTLTYYVEFSGLSGAVAAAHIHTGAVGVAGGVILPLTASASPMTGTLTAANFSASGAVTTFAEAVAAIQAGNTYFNLHTAANPGGEIRGQIGVTVDAPAPTPTPAPSVGATAAPTPPPTSTVDGQGVSDGGSAIPATIAIVAFLAFALVSAGRFEQRRRR